MENIGRTVVHTLGYNTHGMVREAGDLLLAQNKWDGFEYVVVDAGYPLSEMDQWEANLVTKQENSDKIEEYAKTIGANYLYIKNKGVSGNWTQIAQYACIGEDDILIGADPDERPVKEEWVRAVSEVMMADRNIAVCSLAMAEQHELLKNPDFIDEERIVAGHRVMYMKACMNWALIGLSGKFINAVCIAKEWGVPYPNTAPMYGWIEGACWDPIRFLNMRYVVLLDYEVVHLASHPLASAWKVWVTSKAYTTKIGQVSFEKWLTMSEAERNTDAVEELIADGE